MQVECFTLAWKRWTVRTLLPKTTSGELKRSNYRYQNLNGRNLLLNPQNGYVKTDAYLQQFLYHRTSDVNFSHMLFFHIYIAVEKLCLNIKQMLIFLEAAIHRCSSR